eukprot:RCo040484
MRSFLAGLRLDVQQRTGKTLESQEKTLSDIFFRCCEEGDIEMVKRFLEREGMHVNTQNPQSGWTALHFAAFRDDTLLIAFLVNHKVGTFGGINRLISKWCLQTGGPHSRLP